MLNLLSFFYILQDLFGGSTLFFLASYSYISDISDPKTRTTRMAMMDGVFPFGFYLGNAVAGEVADRCGLVYNFALGLLCSVLALAYCLFFVKDSRLARDQRLERELSEEMEALRQQKKFEGK